ncbi:probable serine/threonine-protein kinase PBL19 [Impatiens glandulifera]|uniref:probable serine/threonine-protein kinase PBL19 n=1 Tax=Impatiens glandulifera TaxID=253017 RepID=UPI001FB13641|nr:probable serine/threonine-protein kinase PBL19 [Impatiens glandulifera]
MGCFLFIFNKNKSNSRLSSEPRDQTTRSIGSASSTRSVKEMYKEREHNLRIFSLTELKEATNGFNRSQKIGEGGFGSVYKGTITPPNGSRCHPSLVAIKKLNTQGLQGHKQWLAEVRVLGIVDHPNLVKLLGYCSEDGERGTQLLLVYEYMPNKSLEYHLFNKSGHVLTWLSRLQIMLNAARGLSYLHDGFEIQVIYRDFKPSNILLDEDFNPKLSDFGLAREGPAAGVSHVSTAVAGTYGYAAPEYLDTGHLKAESDTYGFGVVLYEILTGRRAIERNRPLKEQKLLEWVKLYPANSKSFTMIIDPRIRSSYSLAAARRIAKLADLCLNKNPKDRPTMNEVIQSLNQAIEES